MKQWMGRFGSWIDKKWAAWWKSWSGREESFIKVLWKMFRTDLSRLHQRTSFSFIPIEQEKLSDRMSKDVEKVEENSSYENLLNKKWWIHACIMVEFGKKVVQRLTQGCRNHHKYTRTCFLVRFNVSEVPKAEAWKWTRRKLKDGKTLKLSFWRK